MNDESRHRELRISLGAFVLGQLDEGEAGKVRRHVEFCAQCQRELAELMPVAQVLAGARPAVALAPPDQPPADLGERIEKQFESLETENRRRRLVRHGVLAAAGLAAVVLAFLVGVQLAPTDDAPAAQIPLEHIEVGEAVPGLAAEADIVAHTWGVEVKLEATGFVAGDSYAVSVLAADGTRHPAGEFVGTGDQEMTCNLNSSVLRDEATGFEVRDGDGKVVLVSTFPR